MIPNISLPFLPIGPFTLVLAFPTCHERAVDAMWHIVRQRYWITYTGKNHWKISGGSCIFPKIFPFFLKMGKFLPIWRKKWEHFMEDTKVSPNFPIIFPSVLCTHTCTSYQLQIKFFSLNIFLHFHCGWLSQFIFRKMF